MKTKERKVRQNLTISKAERRMMVEGARKEGVSLSDYVGKLLTGAATGKKKGTGKLDAGIDYLIEKMEVVDAISEKIEGLEDLGRKAGKDELSPDVDQNLRALVDDIWQIKNDIRSLRTNGIYNRCVLTGLYEDAAGETKKVIDELLTARGLKADLQQPTAPHDVKEMAVHGTKLFGNKMSGS